MSKKESAEDYPHVITTSSDYRVIICKQDHQWIVQKAEKSSHGRVWRGLRYFRTKKALMAFYGSLQTLSGASELDTLPEHFTARELTRDLVI